MGHGSPESRKVAQQADEGIELEKQGAQDAAVPASKKPPPAPPLAQWQDFSTVLQK